VRRRTLSIIPIAIIAMMAAGTTVASADTSTPQAPVNLGSASSFAVLAKSGVANVYKSTITGDVGASPITGAAIGLTCPEVNGYIHTVDAAGPLPCRVVDPTRLTTAVGDMQTAFADAAGRTLPDALDLGAGQIGGLTLGSRPLQVDQQPCHLKRRHPRGWPERRMDPPGCRNSQRGLR
jgi:hypothetical protein